MITGFDNRAMEGKMTMSEDNNIIELTIEVVSAFVGQNGMRAEEVPAFIAATHAAIKALETPAAAEASEPDQPEHNPAVSVRKSLASKDHIISLIDGKPYKTLRRHLGRHGMTPDEYRQRYKLPAAYPMVAENYSIARREMAKSLGLGRKPKSTTGTTPAPKKTPGRPGRKPKAAPAE